VESKYIGCEVVHWIQDRGQVASSSEHGNTSADCVKDREILDQPSSYYHLVASAQNVHYMYTFHVLESA